MDAFFMAKMAHGVMRQTENGFANLFSIRNYQTVVDKPEPVGVLNAVHARGGGEEFINKWIIAVSIFNSGKNVCVKLKSKGR